MVGSRRYRAPMVKGLAAASAITAIYLLTAVLTSPNIEALRAVQATLSINLYFVIALFLTTWFHWFVRGLSTMSRCRLGAGSKAGYTGGSALASLTSFLSLTQLGCCGFWLYALSLLSNTGVVGAALAGFLIGFQPIVILSGLSLMWVSSLYMLWKIWFNSSR
ncbi:hypothetical protein HRbin01_01361 [archaeon HR01]|nr:hypothetical protein HRbin01_01361 [archaeon HR01]